ncbi:MAG: hypothetical protein ACLT98_16380 [Eggerthellaceae bacterium]
MPRGAGPAHARGHPTRELASRSARCAPIAASITHPHRGGRYNTPQINKLKRGVDILIATPGRLVDLMDRACASAMSARAERADRMLDSGLLASHNHQPRPPRARRC